MHARVQRVAQPDSSRKVTGPQLRRAIESERGAGRPLEHGVRTGAERAFGSDLSDVRVHTGGAADRLSRDLGARAFTNGRDVFFRSGAYRPGSDGGRRLIAHELAHVVQQRGASTGGAMTVNAPGDEHEVAAERAATAAAPALCSCGSCEKCSGKGGASVAEVEDEQDVAGVVAADFARAPGSPPAVQRDLAIEPTVANAPEPVLTQAQIDAAVAYNRFRFKDPFTISFVRDVLGVPKYPAVSDADLANAAARYQADFGLTPDGRIGVATTRRLVAELNAEDQRRFARLLREDNYVTWSNQLAPAWTQCGRFEWNVNFSTSLRGGWLIQRIDFARTATACGPGGADVTPAATARYHEAWWVDANGRVWIPTSLTTPPTTAAPATADDLWSRRNIPGSHGNLTMAGTLYTTLTLPAGFQIHGANSAPESVDLPSTTGAVDADDLGLVEASRRVASEWDCCDPDPALHFHRRR